MIIEYYVMNQSGNRSGETGPVEVFGPAGLYQFFTGLEKFYKYTNFLLIECLQNKFYYFSRIKKSCCVKISFCILFVCRYY